MFSIVVVFMMIIRIENYSSFPNDEEKCNVVLQVFFVHINIITVHPFCEFCTLLTFLSSSP